MNTQLRNTPFFHQFLYKILCKILTVINVYTIQFNKYGYGYQISKLIYIIKHILFHYKIHSIYHPKDMYNVIILTISSFNINTLMILFTSKYSSALPFIVFTIPLNSRINIRIFSKTRKLPKHLLLTCIYIYISCHEKH